MASTKGRLLDDVTASLIYSGLPHCNGNENELYCPIAGCSRSKDKGKCFHQMSQLKNVGRDSISVDLQFSRNVLYMCIELTLTL